MCHNSIRDTETFIQGRAVEWVCGIIIPMKSILTETYDFKCPVTLIGVNFSARKRNVDEPMIEPLA